MSEQENSSKSGQGVVYGEAGIDFSGVSALANTDFKPESKGVAFRNAILESLAKLGLFLFGIILDVLKTIWAIIAGLFTGIYRGIKALGRYFRGNHRKFMEMDKWGKGSFFLQGLGQIKMGQVGQGVVFMVVEVVFVIFMAAAGIVNIINLFSLDAVTRESHTRLLLGIMALIIIAAYWFVWQLGVNATYDSYQILHNFDFRNARENQLAVLNSYGNYQDDQSKGLVEMKHRDVYKLMRGKYAYSYLSARYISYVDFKRVPEREPNAFEKFKQRFKAKFYAGYDKWRVKVKAGKWSSIFAAYLEWKLAKPKSKYGLTVVRNEVEIGLLRFHHTYDKYNDYHSVLRDSEALLRVLENAEQVLKCVYAEDEVSAKNGIAPIPHGSKVKAKEILPRIVGYYECSFDVGITASELVAKALKTSGEKGAVKAIEDTRAAEQERHDLFIYENNEKVKAEAAGIRQAYLDYDKLSNYLLKGKKEFLAELKNVYGISEHYGEMIYGDFKQAVADSPANEEAVKENLARRSENFEPVRELLETYAYHGQPVKFKKQVKQYADEKFATTVLALPVLGAILTCILPLVFSVMIGFTNWDGNHTSYTFTWNMEAWGQVFGMSSTGGDFATAFSTLLIWTLIWAFFATFTNYIFGIIVALLINKKGIKLKTLWRTCFVITIAIPQFITLLSMNLLLAADGPINSALEAAGMAKIPFLSEITNGVAAFDVSQGNYFFIKFMIIVINMWVGIPYTILSTSGILMNIPEDLYESAQIDGASPWTQFWKITMPYIIFVTGPSLLTTFIGNINNFNVIYFLSGGGPTKLDALGNVGAGHTDLLITWLYKLTASRQNPEYAMGSVIGILMFAVCAFFSLIMYKRMGSVQNEEAFQ
ncbi:MAG: sugar ABC transporter permease [Bacilli bacterium]|nr:sugar ABC transporter permease [Bacilli bacterium]